MKKVVLFLVVLFFAGFGAKVQMANVNPIPTFNYQMTPGSAAFMESGTGDTKVKRDMNVEVTTSSDGITDIYVTVLLVKKNSSQTLGPFTVYCDETLTVELPNSGKWGAVVTSSWSVNVSVWIESAKR